MVPSFFSTSTVHNGYSDNFASFDVSQSRSHKNFIGYSDIKLKILNSPKMQNVIGTVNIKENGDYQPVGWL